MDHYRHLTDQEIVSYIMVMEQEIDLCLACDLPIGHLEVQIETLRDILRTRTEKARAQFQIHRRAVVPRLNPN